MSSGIIIVDSSDEEMKPAPSTSKPQPKPAPKRKSNAVASSSEESDDDGDAKGKKKVSVAKVGMKQPVKPVKKPAAKKAKKNTDDEAGATPDKVKWVFKPKTGPSNPGTILIALSFIFD